MLQGMTQACKNTLQCQKLSPPHAVSGKDVPGAFSWVAAVGEALPLDEGEETDGTKLDITCCIADPSSASWFQTWAGFKLVFQKANYATTYTWL